MLVRFRVLCVRCQVFSPDTWPLTLDTSNSAGDWRDRATPVPIPNTVVKPVSADGTALARGWESRPPPAFFRSPPQHTGAGFLVSALRLLRRRLEESGQRRAQAIEIHRLWQEFNSAQRQ